MTDDTTRLVKSARTRLARRGHRPLELGGAAFHGDDEIDGPTVDASEHPAESIGGPAVTAIPHTHDVRDGSALEVRPGVVLSKRYVIDEEVAQGGRSVVFRAHVLTGNDVSGEKPAVAIKLLKDANPSAAAIARLKREFRQTQSLRHPGVPSMIDLECDRGTWSIVMEPLDGQSLRTRLECVATQPLGWYEALRIVGRCVTVLGHAHRQGFAHGDVEPGSVFLQAGGGVKVLGFGAANDLPLAPPFDAFVTEPSTSVATPAYASPEVLDGLAAEPSDDIFSLAVVAYEMLAGRHPFGRVPANEARSRAMAVPPIQDLAPRQNAALASGLAWSRTNRPSSIEEWFDALSNQNPGVAAGATLQRHRPTPTRWLSWRWAGAVAAIAALLAVVIWWSLRDRGTTAPAVVATPKPQVPPLREEPVLDDGSVPLVYVSRLPEPIVKAPPVATPKPKASSKATITPAKRPVEVRRAATLPAASSSRIEADTSIRISESAPVAAVVLRRSGSAESPVTVTWRLQDGSARHGEDFATPSERSTRFAAGQMSRTIYIPLVNDDRPEPEEFFTLILESPAGSFGKSNRVIITILDDD